MGAKQDPDGHEQMAIDQEITDSEASRWKKEFETAAETVNQQAEQISTLIAENTRLVDSVSALDKISRAEKVRADDANARAHSVMISLKNLMEKTIRNARVLLDHVTSELGVDSSTKNTVAEAEVDGQEDSAAKLPKRSEPDPWPSLRPGRIDGEYPVLWHKSSRGRPTPVAEELFVGVPVSAAVEPLARSRGWEFLKGFDRTGAYVTIILAPDWFSQETKRVSVRLHQKAYRTRIQRA